MRCAAILLLWFAFAAVAAGDSERKSILDAARAPVEQELHQPVQFAVKQLRVMQGWAFLHARMQHADGSPVDYAGSAYADAAARGHKSFNYAALLQRQREIWVVRAYSIGPTEPVWETWPHDYAAPPALFADGEAPPP